ncbi:hypothetical protein ENUP19_0121G0201 [Entamoeba nuttalli]|uniref:Uncharacterized protein n=2 Tax=Entamoeba nuttalli TaxID=412467 RepID=K2HF82_ENTNP|nr:hypothetical protein ENU1_054080 [Entamoeba nuttalli P19]EKE41494.1 hypothetical protein ENU1_054080 [Entamoeba nuttalli P19]|eukprot:XP_008856166.1 hypothetical protein ENU1_054080 [Entamoeba nuttalli P19]
MGLKQSGFIEKVNLMTGENFVLTIVVFIALGLMSFLIEKITEKIEHHFSKKEHILSLIQHLYHELMNLGIVSFCFVLFDIAGLYGCIAHNFEKYNKREADVFGIFEVVHITLFAIAVFLIVIGSFVIFMSWIYHKIWKYYERFGYQNSEENFLHKMQQLKNNKWNYLNIVYWIKFEFALRRYQFNIMKEEFIIMEGLPTSFNFARYIVSCFRRLACHHIHVSGKIWLYAITLEVAMTSTLHLKNPNIGSAVLHCIGYFSLFICIIVTLKCRSVVSQLVKLHHSTVNLPVVNFLDDDRNYPSNSEKTQEHSESYSMSEDYSDMRRSLQLQGRKISLNYGIRDVPPPQRPKPPTGIKGLLHKYFGWVPCYNSPYHTTVERLLWFNSHGFLHLVMKCISITQAIYIVLYILFYSRSSVYTWEHILIIIPPIFVLFILVPLSLSSMTLIRYVDKDRLDDVVKSIIFQSISNKFNKRHLFRAVASKEKDKMNVPDKEMVDVFKNRYLATNSTHNIEQLTVLSEIIGTMTEGVDKRNGLNVRKFGDITMINSASGDVIIRGVDPNILEHVFKDVRKYQKKESNQQVETESNTVAINDIDSKQINGNEEKEESIVQPTVIKDVIDNSSDQNDQNNKIPIYNEHTEIEMKESIPRVILSDSCKTNQSGGIDSSSSSQILTSSSSEDDGDNDKTEQQTIPKQPKDYILVQKIAQPTTHSVLNVDDVEILDMSDEA